jgi:hypothetical protein
MILLPLDCALNPLIEKRRSPARVRGDTLTQLAREEKLIQSAK